MNVRIITEESKKDYNHLINHVVQSWEWGEFREKLGQKVLRVGIFDKQKMVNAFQMTLHPLPFTDFTVGYLPKGPLPDKNLAEALQTIGQKYHCLAIKVEPNVQLTTDKPEVNKRFQVSSHPLFTQYNYLLDLTQSEETIFKNMHPKFRYNIKVAQKHGVWVEERVDMEALNIHLKLHFDTTKRQGFHSHNFNYHLSVWQTLQKAKMAKILIAFFKPDKESMPIPLASWMLFNFQDTLYYPYGGSSTEYKNTMASNLLAWESIKLGKKLKLKKFDLWGAGDPNKGEEDNFHGFTRFKKQTGAKLVEYIGTYDIVFNWPLYWIFNMIDGSTKLKVFILKLIKK